MPFTFHPDNKPIHRPGVYLIENLINGKKYVGLSRDVANRLKDHAGGHGSERIKAEIDIYGVTQFLATPLCYSLTDTNCLMWLETSLIAEHDTIAAGYNVQAATQTFGPYGAQHGRAVSAALASPESQSNLRAAAAKRQANPEYTAKQLKSITAARGGPEDQKRRTAKQVETLKNPDVIAKKRASAKAVFQRPGATDALRAGWLEYRNSPDYAERNSNWAKERMKDPTYRKRISDSNKATMSTPEFKAKRSALSLAMQTPELRAKHSARGKSNWANPELREKMRASMSGYRWITDGFNSRHFKGIDEDIPTGWRLGKARKSSIAK